MVLTDIRGSRQHHTFRVDLTETTWDRLWEFHDEINTDDRFRIRDADIAIDKFNIDYRFPTDDLPRRVVITERPGGVHDTDMRFRGDARQGFVDHRFRITFDSSDVAITMPVVPTLLRVDSIRASFFYQRPYTPGVLASDRRDRDPVTEDLYAAADRVETIADDDGANAPAGLAMKPVGSASVEVEDVRVRVRLTLVGGLLLFLGGALVLLIAFLTALGLASLISDILLLAGIIEAVVELGPIAVAGVSAVILALSLLLVIAVPRAVAGFVRGRIVDSLESQDTLDGLNGGGIATYAGEGLAEAVARHVVRQAVDGGVLPADADIDSDRPGRTRLRKQLWQMVHVTTDACRVLIRP